MVTRDVAKVLNCTRLQFYSSCNFESFQTDFTRAMHSCSCDFVYLSFSRCDMIICKGSLQFVRLLVFFLFLFFIAVIYLKAQCELHTFVLSQKNILCYLHSISVTFESFSKVKKINSGR